MLHAIVHNYLRTQTVPANNHPSLLAMLRATEDVPAANELSLTNQTAGRSRSDIPVALVAASV